MGETSLELGIVEAGLRRGQMTGAEPCNAGVGLYVAGSARRRGESGAELAGRHGGCRRKPTSTRAWQGAAVPCVEGRRRGRNCF